MLINFLTDGYLPTDITANFSGKGYSNLRRDAYSIQLQVAYHGLQIMNQQGISIQQKTRNAVQDLLHKYKADGGGNNFDNISTLLNKKDD